jgi:hypothetical protein
MTWPALSVSAVTEFAPHVRPSFVTVPLVLKPGACTAQIQPGTALPLAIRASAETPAIVAVTSAPETLAVMPVGFPY